MMMMYGYVCGYTRLYLQLLPQSSLYSVAISSSVRALHCSPACEPETTKSSLLLIIDQLSHSLGKKHRVTLPLFSYLFQLAQIHGWYYFYASYRLFSYTNVTFNTVIFKYNVYTSMLFLSRRLVCVVLMCINFPVNTCFSCTVIIIIIIIIIISTSS